MAIDQSVDRTKTLGGSEVAVILGISPYDTTARELYLQKKGILKKKDISKIPQVYWGTVLESKIMDEYDIRHNTICVRHESFRDKEHPFMVGNLDGRDDRTIVEAKTVSFNAMYQWGAAGTAEVPEWYAVQVYYYMMLTGALEAHFAVLMAGNIYKEYVLPRDEARINTIREAALKFWWHVEKGIPPKPENYRDILLLWQPQGRVQLDLDPGNPEHQSIIPKVEEALELGGHIDNVTNRYNTLKQEITDFMSISQAKSIYHKGGQAARVQKNKTGFSLYMASEDKAKL